MAPTIEQLSSRNESACVSSTMRLLLLAICLALVSVQAGSSSARAWDSEESNRAVVDWVVKQGGVVRTSSLDMNHADLAA